MWKGWKAGFVAFHAFHTPSFPWLVCRDEHRLDTSQFHSKCNDTASLWNNLCMFKIHATLILFVLLCGKAWSLDEFEGVTCGSDIPKALVGKRISNQRVVVIERRHKSLDLKDLGGTEVSDRLFLVSWSICGSEFELLVNTKSSRIRDVLPFPTHSKTSPEAIGGCHINGNEVPEAIVAVLDNSAGYNARDGLRAKTLLKAKSAWKIDETRERFESLSTEGLSCPLGTVVTLDGGP